MILDFDKSLLKHVHSGILTAYRRLPRPFTGGPK